MRDKNHRHAELPVQLLDLHPHLHAKLRVEIGQRLVEEKNLRLADDGAADRDALALAAGELPGSAVEQLVDLQNFGGLRDAPLDLGLRRAQRLQSEGEVLAAPTYAGRARRTEIPSPGRAWPPEHPSPARRRDGFRRRKPLPVPRSCEAAWIFRSRTGRRKR